MRRNCRPRPQHLARLRLADLALDTRIYNGHVSTCDALWAGLPVLTLLGSQFASRATASMLAAVGLPELVAGSLQEYEDTAVRLASDPEGLCALRQRLDRSRGHRAALRHGALRTEPGACLTRPCGTLFRKAKSPASIEIHEP